MYVHTRGGKKVLPGSGKRYHCLLVSLRVLLLDMLTCLYIHMCVCVCAHLRLFMPIQDVGLPRYLLGQDKTRLFTLSHHHPPSHFTVNVRVLGIYPIPQLWLNRRLPHGSGNAHCIELDLIPTPPHIATTVLDWMLMSEKTLGHSATYLPTYIPT